MPLNANALATVQEAKDYLGHAGAPTPVLELLINDASTAIHRYTSREFMPAVAGPVARKFRYNGAGYLSFAPYELKTVTSVVAYSDLAAGSQVTLATADYRLEPRNGAPETATYLGVLLPRYSTVEPAGASVVVDSPVLSGFDVEVTVTGGWAAGVVPADVKMACLVTVANGYRNPESFASRSLGDFDMAVGPDGTDLGSGLPAAARKRLYVYRRAVFA